jgi:hypothetical protein
MGISTGINTGIRIPLAPMHQMHQMHQTHQTHQTKTPLAVSKSREQSLESGINLPASSPLQCNQRPIFLLIPPPSSLPAFSSSKELR